MSIIDVPDGHIATVVTHLEMTGKPVLKPAGSTLNISIWPIPDLEKYRTLFRKVGEPWLWLSRLLMNDTELRNIIHDPEVEVFTVKNGAQVVGILELDFRDKGQCEIGFLGLIPELNGKGHGRWLMAEALRRAWKPDVSRVWLHTCTLDSPNALGFYQRNGFVPYKREVEIRADPRLSGHLPPGAGPHIPLISSSDRLE